VAPNAAGMIVLIWAAVLFGAAILSGPWLYAGAQAGEKRIAQIASEGIAIEADVFDVQRHRGEGNRRTASIHYHYTVDGQKHIGSTRLRRQDRDRFAVGSRVPIRYLLSEPSASWMVGYDPSREPIWPAFVIPQALVLAAILLVVLIRRQSRLLSEGRAALATVMKAEKVVIKGKTTWRVHYEWMLLSGAKRTGRYKFEKKEPPPPGSLIPIVYDRDEPSRHAKYPLSLVRIKP
jgi:hypothetical protein